jgi:hypothetical protein
LGATPTLRSAAEIAKEPGYRARGFGGGHCNSYLVVAQDIAGADDHRNGSNGFGLGGEVEGVTLSARFSATSEAASYPVTGAPLFLANDFATAREISTKI